MAVTTAVAAVASAAVAGYSAYSQGEAAKEAGKYNAAVAEQNAKMARAQAAAAAERQQRESALRQGSARAAYGASGVDLTGSPLDVLESNAEAEELDRLNILYQGEVGNISYLNDAQLSRMRGNAAYSAGTMGAGASLLTGGYQAGSALSRPGTAPKAGD